MKLTWERTPAPGQVRFKAKVVLEIGPGITFPVVAGGTFTGGGLALSFGDGTGLAPSMTIMEVNQRRGDFTAEAEVTHTYPTGASTFKTAYWSLDRPGRVGRTPFSSGHINNGGVVEPTGPPGPNTLLPAQVNVLVDLSRVKGPGTSISPVVKCRLDAVCRFKVPVTRPEDGWRFRLATPGQAGVAGTRSFAQPGPPQAPSAATLNADTGEYTWDTTGAQLSSGRTFYSTQVIVAREDFAGTVLESFAADFLIELTNAPPSCEDTDGDGFTDDDGDRLCDSWETRGIDWDEDGEVDLKLYDSNQDGTVSSSEKADPNVPDVFVEIDYMEGLRPSRTGLNAVVRAFANAPHPVRLHYVIDDEMLFAEDTIFGGCPEPCPPGAISFDADKGRNFGHVEERLSANSEKVLEAKRQAFHYVEWVNGLAGLGTVSGKAELPGNDFVVALGRWGTASGTRGGRADDQASTFMHELGHNLALRHGGDDNINCKPNYLSVMNYSRQFTGGGALPHRRLDYSRSQLPTLDETALLERAGIGASGPRGELVVFGPGDPPRHSSVVGPIDWDASQPGIQDDPVAVDINDVGADRIACTGNGTVLDGFDDWTNLNFNFQASADFADGSHSTVVSQPEEITYDEVAASSIDSDGDGITDVDDICQSVVNPGQEDTDGDRVGDACQPIARDDRLTAAAGKLTLPGPGLTSNDTVAGGTLEAGTITTAHGGRAEVGADGSLTYAAAAGFTGSDTFDYLLENSPSASTATVTIDVPAGGSPGSPPAKSPVVLPPIGRFPAPTIGKVSVGVTRKGKITLRLSATGAGRLKAVATTRRGAVYGSATRRISAGGKVVLTIRPTKKALRALKRAKKLRLALSVAFTPGHGAPATKRRATVTVRRR